MSLFAQYVTRTEGVLKHIISNHSKPWKRCTLPILDGQPWAELKRATTLERLRRDGAFFTSGRLARLAIDTQLNPDAERDIIGFDPTCGAGDLLLTIARQLDRRETLGETLSHWGRHLIGIDKAPQFVRLTKIRLALLALHLGSIPVVGRSFDLARFFPNIKCGDGLKARDDFRRANFLALNPPFFLAKATSDCTWATGRVTAAAQFMEYAVMNSRGGSNIVAILPEVLRTGTSYHKWRSLIEEHTDRASLRHLGLFDNRADVHVFVLSATKSVKPGAKEITWWRRATNSSVTVNDLFEVHVGSVVPHRHRRAGPQRPYLHARSVDPWKRVDKIKETRNFRGTTFQGPFVVIRRTSRPEDKHRAVATFIGSRGEVAVENHLIVCIPKSGQVADCKSLMRKLRNRSTDVFLNERIRCRHLTVSSVREIPLSNSIKKT